MLRAWLDARGKSIPEFCEGHGLDRVTVQRLLNGVRGKRMSLELATALELATGGDVPAKSWLRPAEVDSTEAA